MDIGSINIHVQTNGHRALDEDDVFTYGTPTCGAVNRHSHAGYLLK